MGTALATIAGLTVSVFAVKLTILDANRLKSKAMRDAFAALILRSFLLSSCTINCNNPSAAPLESTGFTATPVPVPSSTMMVALVKSTVTCAAT